MSVKKGKKKERKIVQSGVAHVQASFNNTIVTITDMNGNTVCGPAPAIKGSRGLGRVLRLPPSVRVRRPLARQWKMACDKSMCM